MAIFFVALALLPSMALGSRCMVCPQPRAVAMHPCCHPSARASGEDPGRWAPQCCGHLAAPASLPAREAQMAQGSPAADVLPASEVSAPISEIDSDRLPGRFSPRRAVPLYTLFSVLLI